MTVYQQTDAKPLYYKKDAIHSLCQPANKAYPIVTWSLITTMAVDRGGNTDKYLYTLSEAWLTVKALYCATSYNCGGG